MNKIFRFLIISFVFLISIVFFFQKQKVDISLAQAGCNNNKPTVTFTPPTQAGNYGDARTYRLNITNNDPAGCPAQTFTLGVLNFFPGQGTPTAWTSTFSSMTSGNISPGDTDSGITVKVTSDPNPGDFTPGNYNFQVGVSGVGTWIGAQGHYVLTGSGPCTNNNPKTSLSPDSQSGNAGDALTYTLKIVNVDTPSCAPHTFTLGVLSFTPCTGLPGCAWTETYSSNTSGSIFPGEADSGITVTITSDPTPGSWSSGNYNFGVGVSGANSTWSQTIGHYVLLTGGVPPPPPPGPGCEKTVPCSCGCPASILCSPCPDPTGKQCEGGLVPCGRTYDDPCTLTCECAPCTLCHLFVLIKRIIDFLAIDIIFPLAVLMFVIGGVMFLTAGGSSDRISMVKKILTATAIGVLICFTSWLIINEIINVLVPAASPLKAWNTISCDVPEGGAVACVTNGTCDGVCPLGCSVAQDPDCGCTTGNSCCGVECDSSSDSDCAAPSCNLPCDDPTTKPCGAPISPKPGCFATCPSGTSCPAGQNCVGNTCVAGCNSYSFLNGSVSPNIVSPGGTVDTTCNYGVLGIDCIDSYIGPNKCNTFNGWNGFQAKFSCTVPAAPGIYPAFCQLRAGSGSNCCAGSVGSAGGSVTVQNAGCTANNPSVLLDPLAQPGNPGDSKIYTVSVTNNDAAACAPRNFNFYLTPPVCPAGWSCTLSKAIVNVAPQTTDSSTTYTVTSPAGASVEPYDISVSAGGAGTSGTGNAKYNVLGAASSLPHISVTAANATVGVPFTVTVTYTHDTGANGGIHLRWVDAYFDIDTTTTVGCDNGGLPSKAGIYEGIDCSNSGIGIPNGTVKTFTLTPLAAGVGPQNMFARAWDLSQDQPCGGGIFDYDRDPLSGRCSLNCRNFPADWPVCDTDSLPITVNAAAACINKNPTVTLDPLAAPGTPGTPIIYTVYVKNNDDAAACAARNFNFFLTPPVCPAGWPSSSCTLSKAIVNVAPQTTDSSTTYTVTSPAGASVEPYDISVSATGAGGTSGTGNAKYNVIP